jgi:hypothetical protein
MVGAAEVTSQKTPFSVVPIGQQVCGTEGCLHATEKKRTLPLPGAELRSSSP